MEVRNLCPLAVVDVVFEPSMPEQELSHLQLGQYGNLVALGVTLRGRCFRITVEALDQTRRLEGD